MYTFFKTALTALTVTTAAAAEPLTVTIMSQNGGGILRAALFDSAEGYDANDFVVGHSIEATVGENTVVFDDLAAGTYGIAVYLDANSNDDLDTNFLGAPKEPF